MHSTLKAIALKAALQNIASPAFIVTEPGGIVEANAPGRALLAGSAKWARRLWVCGSLRPQKFFETTPLYQHGNLVHYLAMLRASVAIELDRLGLAAQQWQLSPRETKVLSHLVEGGPNWSIAKKLGCSERTVEQHVSKIFRRVGVKSRSALLVKFWWELRCSPSSQQRPINDRRPATR